MSEAAPAQDEVQVAPVQSIAPAAVAPRGRGLASLALVLAAAGAGLAGWGAWQVRALHVQSEQQREVLEQTRSQAQTLVQREQSLSAQLAQVPTPEQLEERRQLRASVQGDQQRLGQRLDNVLNASRQDWRLAEAEHLLRLASLRLTALQEINSAKALVQAADQILLEQDDPASFAARAELAKSLEALRSLQQPDRTGMFLQLAPCASKLPSSTRTCRRLSTTAACSPAWPPRVMAAVGGRSGWSGCRITSVSISAPPRIFARCCPGRAWRRCVWP